MSSPAPRPHRFLAGLTATTLAASGLAALAPAAAAAEGFALTRVEGADRFATAAQIARGAFDTASTVVLASGEAGHYADALAGNHLAGRLGAPILLAGKDTLPSATADALRALGTSDVVILGGTGAIGEAVEATLAGDYSVRRIAGADRYTTAQQIATDPAAADIGSVDGRGRTAIVARGGDFADALVAGPVSWALGFPVLITETGALTAATSTALQQLQIENVIITGGTGAVSSAVEQQVLDAGITVTRLHGASRTQTAVEIADFAIDELGFTDEQVDLTRSDDFADALAGGPSAGARLTPIITTAAAGTLGTAASDFLQRRSATLRSGQILGGSAAVSTAVAGAVTAAAEAGRPAEPPAEEEAPVDEPLVQAPVAPAPAAPAPGPAPAPAPAAPAPAAPAPAPGQPAADGPVQEPTTPEEEPAQPAVATEARLTVQNSAAEGPPYVTRDQSVAFFTADTTVAAGEVLVSWSITYGNGLVSRSGNGAPPVQITKAFSTAGEQSATLQVRDSAGTTSTSTASFTVVDPPTARLTSNPSPATGQVEDGGLMVVFDGSTSTAVTGTLQSWSMSYGDGQDAAPRVTSGTGAPPRTLQHTYMEPGTYRATLDVMDASGSVGSTTLSVTAYRATPTADVWGGRMAWSDSGAYTGPYATAGQSTEIRTDGSVPGKGNTWSSWSIDYGDGSPVVTGSGNPTALLRHTFASTGTRTVSLTVQDSSGAVATDSVTLTVVAAPTVELVADQFPAVGSFRDGGVPVTFTASATPGGDGVEIANWYVYYDYCCQSSDYGSGPPPATLRHTYTTPGTYEVRLSVSDSTGATTEEALQVVVHDADAQAVLQGGRYGETGPVGTAGRPVSFHGQESKAGYGADLVTWSLDYGDGTGPAAGEGTPPSWIEHTYESAGSYTATLSVTDSAGSTSTTTLTLTVSEPPVAELTEASRTGSVGEGGVQVTLDPRSSAAGAGRNLTGWSLQAEGHHSGWLYLQGQGAPAELIGHTFVQEGSYNIRLTVSDDTGATTTASLLVEVFDADPTAVLSGGRMVDEGGPYASPAEQVYFEARQSRPGYGEHLTNWSMSFGDDTPVLEGNGQPLGEYLYVTHAYSLPGTYQVSLTVTDSGGGSDTTGFTLTVLTPPSASLSYAQKTADASAFTVTFDGSTSTPNRHELTSWTLSYGDGRTDRGTGSPGATMDHTYARTESGYTARLTVTDRAGGWHTTTAEVLAPVQVLSTQ